ncbi:MAG: hypothetical protein M1825_006213 [Sarcosagium campestre]|nr:MAG: hypothetical protein M1825_006213 [Sarcosagium campestre]
MTSDSFRQHRLQSLDVTAPPRSQSALSDRPSPSSRYHSFQFLPTPIHPEAAYIAASAASQIVTNDQDTQAYNMEDAPSGETALVSPASLKLVNAFLDQLLFTFLSVAKSISLSSLRPAITEVLKPALARDAIAGADQELHEYLGGGEDEELMAFHNGQEPSGEWDLEAVWRKTRLRCMVYSSLGDIEEEDEDMYSEEELQAITAGMHGRFSNNAGMVSPAVAIFLTSILEFIGEQTLVIAGQAAHNRLRSKRRDAGPREDAASPTGVADRVVVEELDTEKVALNGTFGRLWRTWRKRVRSPSTSFSRPLSRDSMVRRRYQPSLTNSSRRSSVDVNEGRLGHNSRSTSLTGVPEEEMAALIPLPMSDDDVREIEIPGLALLYDDDEEGSATTERDTKRRRPRSLVILPSASFGLLTPEPSRPQSPATAKPEESYFNLRTRVRSRSVPTPVNTKFFRGLDDLADDPAFVTPMQSPEHDDSATNADVSAGSGAVTPTPSGKSDDAASSLPLQGTRYHRAVHTQGEDDEIRSIASVSDREAGSGHQPEQKVLRDDSFPDPQADPKAEDYEGEVDEDDEDGTAIGVARTSNVSVPASLLSSRVHSRSSSQTIGSPKERELVEQAVTQGQKGANFNLQSVPNSRGPKSPDRSAGVAREQSNSLTANNALSQAGRNGVSDQGAPPLTPLREMMEAAHDTSDEGSLGGSAPDAKQAARTIAGASGPSNGRPGAETNSTRGYSHTRIPSSSSKIAEIRQQVAPQTVAAPVERASVQRVYSQSMTARDPAPLNTRRSDSFTKGQRPIFGIGTSPGSQRGKGAVARTSEDSSRLSSEKAIKPQDRERSFEQLMQSDQTIQYTLTPQNMREIEAPESPRWAANRPDTADLAAFLKTTGPSGGQNPRSDAQRPTASAKIQSGARNVTALRSSSTNSISTAAAATGQRKVSASRPIPQSSSARLGKLAARDARVESPALREISEFLRSTGPTGDERGASRPQPSTVPNGTRPAVTTAGSRTTASPRTGTQRTESATASQRQSARHQAREATLKHRNDTADLIDFIRAGPSGAGITNGKAERSPAPSNSRASDTNVGAAKASSVQSAAQSMGASSFNSQAPLLGNGKQAANRGQADDEAPVKRKQRRVKDPYAIDTDSEEGEEENAKPKRQEESLMEFLRNVPPPSSDQTSLPSAFDGMPKAGSKTLQKRDNTTSSSTQQPAKRSRFSRSVGAKTSKSTPNIASNGQSVTASSKAPQLSLSNGSDSGGALFTTSGSLPNIAGVSSRSGPGGVAAGTYQPKSARGTRERTDDLTDFLRNSAPPPGSSTQQQPRASPRSTPKEESGFSKMFRKTRKAAGVA